LPIQGLNPADSVNKRFTIRWARYAACSPQRDYIQVQ